MPHARLTGTAWDRKREDYAYTRDLHKSGWAWEFLRRNEAFLMACRLSGDVLLLPEIHASGIHCYSAPEADSVAEKWGLLCFADYKKSVAEIDVFWQPALRSSHLQLRITAHARECGDCLRLAEFKCRRALLRQNEVEHLTIQDRTESIQLTVRGGSLLDAPCRMTFEIKGLERVSSGISALQTLVKLRQKDGSDASNFVTRDSKYFDYLVALDGHLAGRTYRDIAEVLYGADRIGPYWTDDSRGFKSKVRRAVQCGLALMNGGYSELL